jgi:integrase
LLSFDLAAMAGRQAKIISEAIYKDLLVFASTTRYPFRNRLLVLLSVKAGLRAGEIANLTWDMVLNPHGEVGTVIELQDWAAKKHSGRLIPIHPDLHDGLVVWRKSVLPFGTLISSERGQGMRPVSIVNWFAKAYQAIGAEGCSSHSGRRTFITRAARLAHEAGGSLRDVRSWRVTGRFKRHSGTSTVTPMRSATVSVARLLAAPGRFSMTNWRPSRSDSHCPIRRALMSFVPHYRDASSGLRSTARDDRLLLCAGGFAADL